MDWSDEKFEDYLRQFRPVPPKSLPRSRRPLLMFATAAAVVVVVVVSKWVPVNRRATGDLSAPSPTPISSENGTEKTTPATPKPAEASKPVQPDQVPAADASSDTSAISVTPPQSIQSLARRRSSPRSKALSSVATGTSRRLRAGDQVSPPKKTHNVQADYPQAAQDAGIAGIVVIEIVIGEDGSVVEARVVQSIPELDQAAIDAVRQWQFEVTLLNGEPVEVEMSVMINFTLR